MKPNDIWFLWQHIDQWAATRAHLSSCAGAGCSACCRGNLVGHPTEAALMASHAPKRLRDRILSFDPEDKELAICPFLEDGLCSIYRMRPAVCRSRLAATPKDLCDPDLGIAEVAVIVDPHLSGLLALLEPHVELLPTIKELWRNSE